MRIALIVVALFAVSTAKKEKKYNINDILNSLYEILISPEEHIDNDAAKIVLRKFISTNDKVINYETIIPANSLKGAENIGNCIKKELQSIIDNHFGIKVFIQEYLEFFKSISKNIKEALDDFGHGYISQAVKKIMKALDDVVNVSNKFKNFPQDLLNFLEKYLIEETKKFVKCFQITK